MVYIFTQFDTSYGIGGWGGGGQDLIFQFSDDFVTFGSAPLRIPRTVDVVKNSKENIWLQRTLTRYTGGSHL